LTFERYVREVQHLVARRTELDKEIARIARGAPYAAALSKLACLRGISTLTAPALIGGADKDLLRRGTHQPPKDVHPLYRNPTRVRSPPVPCRPAADRGAQPGGGTPTAHDGRRRAAAT
jgi:hypothetical protein